MNEKNKAHNEMILSRMRGAQASHGAHQDDPGNPNVTLPPEMLPAADGPADVFVSTNDGKLRLVYSRE